MERTKAVITAVVLVFNLINANALKCYTCTATSDGIDQRCITNPDLVPGSAITNCNKNYCTSTRVEYIDPKDKVQSMNRDCVDKPIFINKVFEDSTYRTYYRACQTDLCNGGSGKTFSDVDGLVGDNGDAVVLLVPGTKVSGGLALSASLCIFALIILIMNV